MAISGETFVLFVLYVITRWTLYLRAQRSHLQILLVILDRILMLGDVDDTI